MFIPTTGNPSELFVAGGLAARNTVRCLTEARDLTVDVVAAAIHATKRAVLALVDFRNDDVTLQRARDMKPERLARLQESAWVLFGAPWVESKEKFFERMSKEEVVRQQAAAHSGVIGRQGISGSHPPHIPSLIGVKNHKYLDSTGFARHRSIGDLARYAVTNQGLDTMAHYGDFQPSLNETPFSSEKGTRYSDEQFYALALYNYSLEAPKNPNPVDDLATRGQKVFSRQGCAGCHTPPLYTNNKLTVAKGFTVPAFIRCRRCAGSGIAMRLDMADGWILLKLSLEDRKALIAFLKTL